LLRDRIARPGTFWLASGLIGLLALILRLPTLAERPLWLDETYSVWFAARGLVELWTEVPLYETHPPLYYTLLKGWTTLFGDSEAALRAPSVIASVATVGLLSLSGRILRGGPAADLAALLAALLLAINQGSIFFAQEARPYAIESLSALSAILSALRLLQCLASSDADDRPSFLPSALALGLSGGLTLWMHNTAVFMTFGLWLGLGLAVLTVVPGRKPRNLAVVFFSGLLALAIWAPFLPTLLAQMKGVHGMDFWIRPAASDLWTAWQLAAGGQLPFAPVVGAAILGLVGLWRRNAAMAMTMGAVLVLPLYMAVAAGYIFRPIYVSRLFEWMTAPLLMLSGIGVIMATSARAFRAALAAAAVVTTGLSTIPVTGYEDWRGIVDTIAQKSEPGDLLIATPNDTAFGLHYYGAGNPRIPESRFIPASFPYRNADRRYSTNLGVPLIEAGDAEIARGIAAGRKRVWLLERSPGLSDPRGVLRRELGKTRKGAVIFEDGVVTITLYE
jgi:hypothetical protein